MHTKGALTLAAGMAPARGCSCHAPHHSSDPGRFPWWGREFPSQQKSWILPHHSPPLDRGLQGTLLLSVPGPAEHILQDFQSSPPLLQLCINHLWFLNNKDTLSTRFRQDAKRKSTARRTNRWRLASLQENQKAFRAFRALSRKSLAFLGLKALFMRNNWPSEMLAWCTITWQLSRRKKYLNI